MTRISKNKAKKILSQILVQIAGLQRDDLDWKLVDVISGYSLGGGKYRLKINDDWDGHYFECVQLNKKRKITFYSSFRTVNKKDYYSYDGELLNSKQVSKIKNYLL